MDGKLVECADKISNLESLYNLYQEEGKEVWKSFNKPKEEQKWYYTNMYQAVLMNTTEENMLFDRNKMSQSNLRHFLVHCNFIENYFLLCQNMNELKEKGNKIYL